MNNEFRMVRRRQVELKRVTSGRHQDKAWSTFSFCCQRAGSATPITDPCEQQRGQSAEQKHLAPAEVATDGEISKRCEQKADVVARVHKSGAADAPTFGPLFRYKGAAHGPFATDADAGEQAENRELPDVDHERAEQSEGGIPKNREHQSANAAEFISDWTP